LVNSGHSGQRAIGSLIALCDQLLNRWFNLIVIEASVTIGVNHRHDRVNATREIGATGR
jgi:predicted ATP-dependent Lon-type protease